MKLFANKKPHLKTDAGNHTPWFRTINSQFRQLDRLQEPRQIGNYRLSSCACPRCKDKLLYKVSFPLGKDPRFEYFLNGPDSHRHSLSPSRIFTCPDCRTMYAVHKGTSLAGAKEVVMAAFPADYEGGHQYMEHFYFFNELGSLRACRKD